MAGFIFHVEFGMNETSLTRALEEGNWSLAEHYIITSQSASYLDDGCYQRIPLYICLCGRDEFGLELRPRSLHIARLLIERGANVNLRVPTTNYGAEYMSPGKSCVELLIDFYIRLCQSSPPWSPDQEPVVGLHREPVASPVELQAQLRDLLFDALHHGGDLGVVDESRLTPVHRAASGGDLPLLRLLCDCGADLSAVDASGNTPLLSLCSVPDPQSINSDTLSSSSAIGTLSVTFNDDGLANSKEKYDESELKGVDEKNRENTRESSPSDSCFSELGGSESVTSLRVDPEMLQFLMRQENVLVNQRNQAGQTALFHLMMRGDINGCQTLLSSGADPSLKGSIWQSRRQTHQLSPLFASLASVKMHHRLPGPDNIHQRFVAWTRIIGPLVDNGHFEIPSIHSELRELIHRCSPDLHHLSTHNTSGLVSLMLGHNSPGGLKQLATRSVMQCCLENQPWLLSVCAARIPNNSQVELVLTDRHIFQQFVSSVLDSRALKTLLQQLCLPSSLLLNFEAHLLYLRLASWLQDCQAYKPRRSLVLPGDEDSDDSLATSDSDSEGEAQGDSDLDYW